MSGAQKVLEFILDAVAPEFVPIVAFPHDGPFRQLLRDRSIKTVLYPLGTYQSGQKSRAEMMAFAVRSMACGLKLANLIRREKVALIYVNGPRCLPAGVVAARLTGRPLLFHLQLTLCRRREAMVVARLARYAGKLVSCAHAAAQPLLDENPALNKVLQVIYNPLSESEGRAERTPDGLALSSPFTIGMVGRITEPKGHLNLLKAVSALPLHLQKKIRLIVVGAPAPGNAADLAYLSRVKELAVRLNLQNPLDGLSDGSHSLLCFHGRGGATFVRPGGRRAACGHNGSSSGRDSGYRLANRRDSRGHPRWRQRPSGHPGR